MNKKLLKAFKASGLTKYRLAQRSGLGQTTIGRWVRGEVDLRLSSAEAIAKALGLKLEVK